jgi:hypothetical protein
MSHIDPATWTQLIVAVSTLFVAIAGWLKSQSNSRKIDANTNLTQSTHDATNGKMEQLIGVVKVAAFAAGVKEQVDKQADITAAVDASKVKEK